MDEFQLIGKYFARGESGSNIVLGIGDDGAVCDCPPDCQLVAVLDTLVDGVHYPRSLAAYDIGYRAAAVNLSDIAAMGGTPAWMLLGLTLPAVDDDWLRGFADGLFAVADRYGVTLAGGDTTRGAQTVVTVQMAGFVLRDGYLARSGAGFGDAIVVSGTPGDAAAGLELLQSGREGDNAYLVGRFREPAPRVELGQALVGVASAAIDVSDGLHADLQHLLRASSCGGVLDLNLLPLSDELLDQAGRERARDLALAGGDDYELCFTVPDAEVSKLPAIAAATGVRLTRVGTVEQDTMLRVTDDGVSVDRPPRGYRHF